ncbi:ATP-binding protein [Colwellia sp. RSH04]|uniref:sensor histidine kinase n=1 Tax=Colwellia sp. RSH04 TaxID=2305464 RepID=UPI000E582BAD|nr:ATP-binding protein [Colwellia sp. RSH04]RHW77350.1 sensor histidine kinase [Colwellia sp. RSH04]
MSLSLYQRLALTVTGAFIVVAYLLFWWSSALAEQAKHQAEQQLHLALAEHLANDNPLLQDGVYDKPALENLFHTLMVLGPAFEFYFLDPSGNILTYSADSNKIKRQSVELAPLVTLIDKPEQLPVYGDDPRSFNEQKIFSAAPIYNQGNLQGYLYVIIGGEIYDSVFARVKTNQQLMQHGFIIIAAFVLVLILLLVLLRYFTKPIRQLVSEMELVKSHQFDCANINLSHWQANKKNEIQLLGRTFAEMVTKINEQLMQLTDNERIRKELLAQLSHDLRTPLAAMQGYVETIAIKGDDLPKEDRDAYLRTVLRNGKQLKLLIDQIFELAHLEDGQVSVNLETFPIGELIYDIVAKFALKAREKNIKLSLNPAQCGFLVYSDIAKLERILSNLIDNALRHTPENGEITIDIVNDNNRVNVAVIDTGTGISQKDLAYIFDARYRASNARGEKHKHAGLGLAITKKLASLLNANMQVTSELGKGSCFSFSLKSVIV